MPNVMAVIAFHLSCSEKPKSPDFIIVSQLHWHLLAGIITRVIVKLRRVLVDEGRCHASGTSTGG